MFSQSNKDTRKADKVDKADKTNKTDKADKSDNADRKVNKDNEEEEPAAEQETQEFRSIKDALEVFMTRKADYHRDDAAQFIRRQVLAEIRQNTAGESNEQSIFPILALPMETQIMIWKEALRKPNIHFVNVKRKEDPQSRIPGDGPGERDIEFWRVSLHPVPKGNDHSGFRRMAELATICPAAATAIKLATSEKSRLSFPHLKWSGIDLQTDLTCFQFMTPTRPPMPHDPVQSFGHWSPSNYWFDAFRLQRDRSAELLRGIRRVAVQWSEKLPRCELARYDLVFHCIWCRGSHSNWRFCPLELAGFLDLFDQLEEFYIIVPYGQSAEHMAESEEYLFPFFEKMTPTVRAENNIDVFYDAKQPYVQVCRVPPGTKNPWKKFGFRENFNKGHTEVLHTLALTRHHYTAARFPRGMVFEPAEPFRRSSNERRAVKFKMLLAAKSRCHRLHIE
ncbi:hypothetical protein QBC47DRAFT_431267 [Echria macrotheca]|uniref:Uncharacterized protein n=1 Tax=Echria macrotheca TaxID=438768 RepID=A0AAJ0F9B9_9PEZI|nr:hypothetical protein QBC47DRAFT_431267 [Echria macrotheca]